MFIIGKCQNNHFQSHPGVSFLPARYLCHALRTLLSGNDLYWLSRNLALLHGGSNKKSGGDRVVQLRQVHRYVTFLQQTIRRLRLAESAFTLEPRGVARSVSLYVLGHCFKLIALGLGRADTLPNFYSVVFDFPRIDFEITGSGNDGEIYEKIIYYSHTLSQLRSPPGILR